MLKTDLVLLSQQAEEIKQISAQLNSWQEDLVQAKNRLAQYSHLSGVIASLNESSRKMTDQSAKVLQMGVALESIGQTYQTTETRIVRFCEETEISNELQKAANQDLTWVRDLL